jgi:hypothetical protein
MRKVKCRMTNTENTRTLEGGGQVMFKTHPTWKVIKLHVDYVMCNKVIQGKSEVMVRVSLCLYKHHVMKMYLLLN